MEEKQQEAGKTQQTRLVTLNRGANKKAKDRAMPFLFPEDV